MQAAINKKNISVQDALRIKNELEASKAQAEKKLVEARAEAESNRIIQQSITKDLIYLKAIDKWDGKGPKFVGNKGFVTTSGD
jgi:hypothetical protein